MATSFRWPVLLFVPNLIGYFRVACMTLSFKYARSNHRLALVLYVLNFAGDAVDGLAARTLNQASKFGGVLDMTTDRVSTAGLTAFLAVLYPDEAFMFVMLLVLDIFSHWAHCMAARGHHKQSQGNWVLRVYYGNYPFFGFCCLSQEFYYLARWLLAFEPDVALNVAETTVTLQAMTTYVFGFGCFLKQVVNVAQWWNAACILADDDKEERARKSREEAAAKGERATKVD